MRNVEYNLQITHVHARHLYLQPDSDMREENQKVAGISENITFNKHRNNVYILKSIYSHLPNTMLSMGNLVD